MRSGTILCAAALVLAGLTACARDEPRSYLDLVTSFGRAAVEYAGAIVPRAEADGGLLFLPAGSSAAYSFEARPESSLRIGRLAIRGEGAQLRLTLSTDSDDTLFQEVLDRPGRNLSVELPTRDAIPTRLTLSVGTSTVEGDGVLLTRPALWWSAPPDDELPTLAFDDISKPNVIVYLIDTLRRDRLGCYGYSRPVSPNIDAFAAGATVYERSYGQSSWTKASMASMWTGLWPPAHGTYTWSHKLPEESETLAEMLRDLGYDTAAFVTNVNAGPAFGLDQGFEHLWYERKELSHVVNQEVFAWLDARESDKPLFLYVHTMDPHAGYNPEEPYRSRFAPTADEMKPWQPKWRWPIENLPFFSDLYDGEIAQNDASFGALMADLRERDLFDRSLIILLSDHGEEFKEHGGWRHGRVLHYGSLDVPFIVKFPGQRTGRRSQTPVSHVDLLPSVLSFSRVEPPPGLDGQSVSEAEPRPVFSHLRLGKAPLQYSVVDLGWKLIQVHGSEPRTQLFDLTADPDEKNDLAGRLPIRAQLLEGLLREQLAKAAAGSAEEIELTDDLQDQLRALGYLQ